MNFTANFAFDRLSDGARQGIKEAICSRGHRKGLLKLNPPASNTFAYSAWMGIMLHLNGGRVAIWGIMNMSERQKEVFVEVDKYASTMHHVVNETLQHPFDFNTYHYQHVIDDAPTAEECRIYGRDAKQLTLFPYFKAHVQEGE